MKRMICAVMILTVMLTLCACPKDGGEVHAHAYTEAVTKEASCGEKGEKTFTCTCGDSYTEEIPQLEHSYVGGKCEHCDGQQENYKKLGEGKWRLYVITEGGGLEIVMLRFPGTMSCSVYDVYNPEWHEGATIMEYEGKKYVSAGFGVGGEITSFKEEGNTITVNVEGMGNTGALVLERTAGDQLTVKEITGTVIDSIVTEFSKPGVVYTWDV